MQGQTIEAKIVVDAALAVSQLAKFDQETKAAEKALRDADAATKAFEKSQRDAVAAVTAIDEKIARYNRDMMALGAAILSGKGNVAAYEKELRQLGRELDSLNGKTSPTIKKTQEFAGAASQVQGGARSSGLAVLEFSRAFEDAQYGIGGVLNNIPGLLTALGIGAGLTGVVSAAAVGVSVLAKNFGAVDPAAQEATDSAKERVRSLRDEIRGLGSELRALQVGAERASMEEQAAAVEAAARAAAAALAPVGGMERFRRLEDNEKLVGTIAAQMETAKKAVESLDLEMAKLAAMKRKQDEIDSQRRIDLAVDTANAITEAEIRAANEREKARSKKKEDKAAFLFDPDVIIGNMQLAEDRLRKFGADYGALLGKNIEDMKTKAAEDGAANRIAIAEQEAFDIRDIVISSMGGLDQMTVGAVSTIASGLSQVTTDLITGQEHVAERFGALVMQQAGQSLISSGTKLAGEAVVSLFTPGAQPLAAAQGGAAAGLIAAGIGLGGVATGLEHIAAGGKLGKPIDKSGDRDKGVSPKNYARDKGGGPLVINVSYGVGGPLPEDTAREIAKVQRQGARRGGA